MDQSELGIERMDTAGSLLLAADGDAPPNHVGLTNDAVFLIEFVHVARLISRLAS